jgi:two-component system sensor histidine kinase UhpB
MHRQPRQSRAPSLLWRIFITNALLFVVAWAGLAFSPATVKPPFVLGGIVGVAVLGLLLLANFAALRRALAPLNRLTAVARRFDPLRPGPRIPVYAHDAEIVELTRAFNDMLGRLEHERRESARRALEAQEDERARIARELHDEIGQSLTAVLLGIEHAQRTAPPATSEALIPIRETARSSLEEVRRIAQRLRPEALDDLGLRSALMHLTERIADRSSVRVGRNISRHLPTLEPEKELVIYRVAQEALTNVLRHAEAQHVVVNLGVANGSVILRVEDDGCGPRGEENGGIKGMRERAILIGADLAIEPKPGGGTRVRLAVAAE